MQRRGGSLELLKPIGIFRHPTNVEHFLVFKDEARKGHWLVSSTTGTSTWIDDLMLAEGIDAVTVALRARLSDENLYERVVIDDTDLFERAFVESPARTG